MSTSLTESGRLFHRGFAVETTRIWRPVLGFQTVGTCWFLPLIPLLERLGTSRRDEWW